MDSVEPAKMSLKLLSLDWIPLLFEVYRGMRKFLKQQTHEGLYDVLEYDSVLELVDSKGEIAIFNKETTGKIPARKCYCFSRLCLGRWRTLALHNFTGD